MEDSAKQQADFERTYPIHPHLKKWEAGDNSSHLHKIYVPPAYLTQPGINYTGTKSPSRRVTATEMVSPRKDDDNAR